jgi:hypothetical protein
MQEEIINLLHREGYPCPVADRWRQIHNIPGSCTGMEGICIVVTPLIALMKDQVENLLKRGIKAHGNFFGMSRV